MVKVTGNVDRDLVEWVDVMIKKHRFRDRTAAMNLAFQVLKESWESKNV